MDLKSTPQLSKNLLFGKAYYTLSNLDLNGWGSRCISHAAACCDFTSFFAFLFRPLPLPGIFIQSCNYLSSGVSVTTGDMLGYAYLVLQESANTPEIDVSVVIRGDTERVYTL